MVYLYPHTKAYLHTDRHASINYIVNGLVYYPPPKAHSGTNSTKWNFKARKKGDRNEAIGFGQEEVTEHLLVIQGEWDTIERLISAKWMACSQARGREEVSQTEPIEQIIKLLSALKEKRERP